MEIQFSYDADADSLAVNDVQFPAGTFRTAGGELRSIGGAVVEPRGGGIFFVHIPPFVPGREVKPQPAGPTRLTSIHTAARFDQRDDRYIAGPPLGSAGARDTFVSMRGYARATIIINIENGTAVSPAVISVKQGRLLNGKGQKPIAFDRMRVNLDAAASQTLVETEVIGNAFTTDATDGKRSMYVIDIDHDALDTVEGCHLLRVEATGMANAIGSVTYLLWGSRSSGANPLAG